jgi:hypothetical protein
MDRQVFDARTRLDMYHVLTSIRPANRISKYPYNPWTHTKVEITMNELELFEHEKGIFKTTKPGKKGGKEGDDILVYVIQSEESRNAFDHL